MKNFIKHVTLGTVLGLAVMVGGVGQANALLIGQDIQLTFEAPTVGAVLVGPQTETVGVGVEYPNFGGAGIADIDLSDTMIAINFLTGGTFDADLFRGLHFVDINNGIPAWVASVNVGLTTPGLLGGFVTTFTNNDIFVNLAGLTVAYGDMIVLDVAPVPEPSTMLLFGSGLAGIVAWRARKRHA